MRAIRSVLGASLALSIGPAFAQIDPDTVENIRRNRQALGAYTWDSRTSIRSKGELLGEISHRVRFDAAGRIHREVNDRSAPGDSDGRRGRLNAKEQEEIFVLMEELRDFIAEYLYPDQDKLWTFLRSSIVTEEQGPSGDLTRVTSGSFIMPRDSVQLWVDSDTQRWRKLEIRSTFRGDSVHLQTVFSDLPAGPAYPLRTILFLSERELELTTENSEPVLRNGRAGEDGSRPGSEPE